MVEFDEEPEPEFKTPAHLLREDGNIKMEDRLRKHLFAVTDQPEKPRKKVFPSRFTEIKEFTVPEVEIPEFLMSREQVDDKCEGTYDEDSTTSPSW
jgi:hypothetical protein